MCHLSRVSGFGEQPILLQILDTLERGVISLRIEYLNFFCWTVANLKSPKLQTNVQLRADLGTGTVDYIDARPLGSTLQKNLSPASTLRDILKLFNK